MYLSWDDTFDTSAYFMPSLVGGSIEYDVDISKQSCGCVTALYTITMPEEANKEDPFKYCDANYVGGYGCPEFDIMEAN